MQMLWPEVPAITANGDPSVVDHPANVAPPAVAAASSRIDSLLPTPTLSPVELLSVFGKPPLTAPVQFVAAEYTVSTNCGVAPFGATSNLTVPSVKSSPATDPDAPSARTW